MGKILGLLVGNVTPYRVVFLIVFFNNTAVAYVGSCTVFTGLDQLPVDIQVSTAVMGLLEAFAIMIFLKIF